MAQTAENSGEVTESDLDEIELEETVSEGLESASSFLGGYDQLLVVSPSTELYDPVSESVEYVEELVPSMAHYKDESDTVSRINEREGNVLIVGLGLDMDMPYINERNSDDFEFEGNWWDNLEEVEAEVVLDRISYEGAVHVPRGAEIDKKELNGYGDVYHLA